MSCTRGSGTSSSRSNAPAPRAACRPAAPRRTGPSAGPSPWCRGGRRERRRAGGGFRRRRSSMPSFDAAGRLTARIVAATFASSGPSYSPARANRKAPGDWGQTPRNSRAKRQLIRDSRLATHAAASPRPSVCVGDQPRRHRAAHAGAARKALRLPPGVTEARVIDLLWHTPTGVIDRRATPTIAAAVPGTIATLQVRVLKHRGPPGGNSRAPYKVACEDDTGRIDLVFFHAEPSLSSASCRRAASATSAGASRPTTTRSRCRIRTISSPRRRAPTCRARAGLSADRGLSGKVLLKAMRGALERVPQLPEWQDVAWLERQGWPTSRGARAAAPAREAADVPPARPPWQRLATTSCLPAAGARPGAPELKQQPGRRIVATAASARGSPTPCLSPHRLAAPGVEGDRRRIWPRRTACCGSCRAMWAPARRWWR